MTVFITQEVRGRDLSDALGYGDLEILIPDEYVDMNDVDYEFEFKAKDYALERFEKEFKI